MSLASFIIKSLDNVSLRIKSEIVSQIPITLRHKTIFYIMKRRFSWQIDDFMEKARNRRRYPYRGNIYNIYIIRPFTRISLFSVYQICNMTPRLSVQTSLFDLVFFTVKCLAELAGYTKESSVNLDNPICNFIRKPWSHKPSECRGPHDASIKRTG